MLPGRRVGWLFLPALLLCGGCDLGDYEKREDEERARITYFDAENKALADPINLPRRKVTVVVTDKKGKTEKKAETNPVQKLDVFLRPPKGYSGRITKDDEANPFNNVLYRYAAPANSVYNLFVGAVIDKKKSADEFHKEVRTALAQFYDKEYKPLKLNLTPQKTVTDRRQPLKTRRDQALPVVFQKVTYNDGPNQKGVQFQIFFFKSGADQVAIVFEMPASETARWEGALDYSLKTFDTRAGAANKRRAYLSRSG
jgi:hypothetical protein